MRFVLKKKKNKKKFDVRITVCHCSRFLPRRWVKFGKPHDFVFVGKETIATASGIYVSFLDLNTGERRVERFDSKERGDGASGLAGHSVYIYIYAYNYS